MTDLLPLPPQGETPQYIELVEAYHTYTSCLMQSIESDFPSKDIGTWVPYAMYFHILQLSNAVGSLVKLGYADEALPLARVTISATLNLLFIVVSGNPGGWALRYWLEVGHQEIKMLKYQKRRGCSGRQLDQLLLLSKERLRDAKKTAMAEDISFPQKLITNGNKKPAQTWTGLSERAMAAHLDLLDWYDSEYQYASSYVHANSIALLPLGHEIMDGKRPKFGPDFQAPIAALATAGNAMRYASVGFMKHFGLEERDSTFQAVSNSWSGALNKFKEETGANVVTTQLFGVSGE